MKECLCHHCFNENECRRNWQPAFSAPEEEPEPKFKVGDTVNEPRLAFRLCDDQGGPYGKIELVLKSGYGDYWYRVRWENGKYETLIEKELARQRGTRLRPDPKPKFKVGDPVFVLDDKVWLVIEDIIWKRGAVVSDDAHYVYFDDDHHKNDCSIKDITDRPTWLEEFGDSREGRKKLAHELVEGKRHAEYRPHQDEWSRVSISGYYELISTIMAVGTNAGAILAYHRFTPGGPKGNK